MLESVKRRTQPMESATALDVHQSIQGPCRHATRLLGGIVWILHVVHGCVLFLETCQQLPAGRSTLYSSLIDVACFNALG